MLQRISDNSSVIKSESNREAAMQNPVVERVTQEGSDAVLRTSKLKIKQSDDIIENYKLRLKALINPAQWQRLGVGNN
jgi:hypothetical protein